MTYSTNLENETLSSRFLMIMKPRRLMDPIAWSLVSGNIFTQPFNLGLISKLEKNGKLITEATSAALSDGDWFQDTENKLLYLQQASPETFSIVAAYQIFLSTDEANWHIDPLDISTAQVHYEPFIIRAPDIQKGTDDQLLGTFPVFSSSVNLINASHFWEEHVFASSFNRAEVLVYHNVGELIVANIKKLVAGEMSNVNWNDSQVTINILDQNDVLGENFRHDKTGNPNAEFFFSSTGGLSDLDPFFEGRPIRKVYGVVKGFIPVNIDFVNEAPTTSNNRIWAVVKTSANHESFAVTTLTTVPASPASTTTRTYVTSANGIMVDDGVHINHSVNPDEYPIVTVVNKIGAHYIEHAVLTNAAISTTTVSRGFISRVDIIHGGRLLTAKFPRDYSFSSTAGIRTFSFNGSMETNVGFPVGEALAPEDKIFCTVYGVQDSTYIESTETESHTNGPQIIIRLLQNFLKLDSTAFNKTNLETLAATITDDIGFAIPKDSNSNFPTYREILEGIAQTLLIKIFVNNNNEIDIVQTGPQGSVDDTIGNDQITRNSFSWEFDYKDIVSQVIVQYAHAESSKTGLRQDDFRTESFQSDTAKFLHNTNRQKSFTSFHILASDAAILAERLAYALGDRRGKSNIRTNDEFFLTEINDVITLSREALPGSEFVAGTENSQTFTVTSSNKNLDSVRLTLDDQKGIEDNSGSW